MRQRQNREADSAPADSAPSSACRNWLNGFGTDTVSAADRPSFTSQILFPGGGLNGCRLLFKKSSFGAPR
jgi:hypothetical protein